MRSHPYSENVVWLTGLSGSGKSTIAQSLLAHTRGRDLRSVILDGDELRKGLNSDLSFSAEDRTENLRRIAHVAKLFTEQGFLAIVATISPSREHRETARRIIGEGFIEVFVDTSIEICAQRDPKGLYRRAYCGEIHGFTGVAAPYDIPHNPELSLATESLSVQESVQAIMDHLLARSTVQDSPLLAD
jgi:adenylyl-sulfate kinase